jgi:hypothetical protein
MRILITPTGSILPTEMYDNIYIHHTNPTQYSSSSNKSITTFILSEKFITTLIFIRQIHHDIHIHLASSRQAQA